MINPVEIERILAQHPGVLQARCYAEPHAILGFVLIADVAVKAIGGITELALKKHCDAHLDSHAVPRQFRLVSSLPVADSGKTESIHSQSPLL